MALIARQSDVCAGKSKSSYRRVIEFRSEPRRGCVALLTGRGESGSYVIGTLCGVEIVLVTTDASRRCAGSLAAGVASYAFKFRVSSGEGEPGDVVVEFRAQPGVHRLVALLAVG